MGFLRWATTFTKISGWSDLGVILNSHVWDEMTGIRSRRQVGKCVSNVASQECASRQKGNLPGVLTS